ncbi:sugar transferase [Campylobacter sp. 2018MI35]|nr:sugar transferase [Campylobacter sp. 2018MI34]
MFSWYHQSFRLLDYDFIINGEIKIHTFFDEKVKKPRYDTYNQNYENNHRVGIVGFLLISQDAILTTEIPQETSFKISRTYDFSYFYEYLKEYKIFTEQYNQKRDPIKSIPLRNQIKEKDNTISTLNQEKIILQNELNSLPIKKQNLELANLEQDLIFKKLQNKKLAKQMGIKLNTIIPKLTMINPNSAKARIHNHLSYKLGQALIENSKSVFGYIRMPFILSYIADKHKLEQKIYKEKIKQNSSFTLPPLETYPDYNEALKEKECFTYKLGEAFIKASNNWYGGGYIKFIFQDVPRLKKEFGKS